MKSKYSHSCYYNPVYRKIFDNEIYLKMRKELTRVKEHGFARIMVFLSYLIFTGIHYAKEKVCEELRDIGSKNFRTMYVNINYHM